MFPERSGTFPNLMKKTSTLKSTSMEPLTTEGREKLIWQYVDEIIDGMDLKDCLRILAEQFYENLEGYTNEELLTEIKEFYPHLLEDATIKPSTNETP